MTRKQSYSAPAACVLDCGGCDAAFPILLSLIWLYAMRFQTKGGAHASRVPYSASRRVHPLSLRAPSALLNRKLTPDRQIHLKIKPKSSRIGPKNESAVSSLPKAIEGYPSLLKPIFKNLFFGRRNCLVFVSAFANHPCGCRLQGQANIFPITVDGRHPR
jgi:hypothetical protein